VVALVLLLCALETGAHAQTADDRGGFTARQVSLSSGYTAVQLPPVTFGGNLPNDILTEDLMTIGAAEIAWRHGTPRTTYALDLFGTYTARARYSQLSAPGGDLTFGVSRAFGRRWRLQAGVATALASSDQLGFQPTRIRRLISDATSVEDLAGTVALASSPDPDVTRAVLLVPISQSLDESDIYGNRIMVSSGRSEATYAHSVRLTTYFRGSYTVVRQISSSHDPGQAPPSPDSTAERATAGVRYRRSERTQLTAALDWSQTSGVSADKALFATLGHGWSGRKWLTAATVGVAFRPFAGTAGVAPETTSATRAPALIWSAAIGYKFRAQTLLVQYSRAPHDEYGRGGRNLETGFQGNVQSVAGSWSWSAPRSRWSAQSDVSMLRRPGNFSYIDSWLSTVGIGRQLGPRVRLVGRP
jgi:hypothetical protein